MDDLDDEENHVPPNVEDPQATHDDGQAPPQGIKCGGEDGENSGGMSQRRRLNAGMPDSFSVRRGRGAHWLFPLLPNANLGFGFL